MAAVAQLTLEDLRAGLGWRKQLDKLFVIVGLLVMIACLPESPFMGEFPFCSFAWLKEGFTAMPIQMFNWVSRPDPAFQVNAAAAGAILLGMTLLMNGVAIYVRFRFRKRINW